MKKSALKTFNKLFYCSIILTIVWSCGLDNFSNNSEITTLTKIHSDQEEAIFFMINKNDDITNRVKSMYATLRATGAPYEETSRVKEILNTVEATNELTRSIHNDLAKRTLLILISSIDATTNMEEFENIEEAILSGDYEAQTKLNVLNEKINQLGINESYGNGMNENSLNDLFHISEDGYIFIKNLSNYLNKNDYDTPTRLLAGESFEHIAPEGMQLADNLHNYRNQMLGLIANHKGIDRYGNELAYEMDTLLIENPDCPNGNADYNTLKKHLFKIHKESISKINFYGLSNITLKCTKKNLAPNIPSSLTYANSSSSITLTWTDNQTEAITGYKVIRKTVVTDNFTTVSTITDNTTRTYADTDVSTGTYWYRVRAYNSNGDGTPSKVVKSEFP